MFKGIPAPPGSPWPMPKEMKDTSNNLFYLDMNNFKITDNMGVDCDIIEENKKIYKKVLFPPMSEFHSLPLNSDFLFELKLEVEEKNTCPGYPDLTMDESYELRVNSGIAKIKANSVWGAVRGMETFSQLTFISSKKVKNIFK